MTECSHEEGIVPACALEFAPQGRAVWVGSQDIEGEPAQNGEVFGSMVPSRAIAVLGEMNVEHPMQLVFDTPLAAGDVQELLGRHVFGQEIVAYDLRAGRASACAR